MRILVTGGAGYIGSHTVVQLVSLGHEVVIVDNFSNSSRTACERVERIVGKDIVVHDLDLCDRESTENILSGGGFEAVFHFAGLKSVGESQRIPGEYYRNNIDSTLSLLDAMKSAGVKKFVFSSSATVYGSEQEGARESQLTFAINPYGWTKVMGEQILFDTAMADPSWRIAVLRYFNPVGAHSSGMIGEDPVGIPSNLMPFIAQVASGRREALSIFGDDYSTPDGTCRRDYIHVEDLAAGHIAALAVLDRTNEALSTWNLGTGRPTSVFEMLKAFEKVVGRPIPYEVVGRRSGDAATSYADPARAHAELNWSAKRSVEDMCTDLWRWQRMNPRGYSVE